MPVTVPNNHRVHTTGGHCEVVVSTRSHFSPPSHPPLPPSLDVRGRAGGLPGHVSRTTHPRLAHTSIALSSDWVPQWIPPRTCKIVGMHPRRCSMRWAIPRFTASSSTYRTRAPARAPMPADPGPLPAAPDGDGTPDSTRADASPPPSPSLPRPGPAPNQARGVDAPGLHADERVGQGSGARPGGPSLNARRIPSSGLSLATLFRDTGSKRDTDTDMVSFRVARLACFRVAASGLTWEAPSADHVAASSSWSAAWTLPGRGSTLLCKIRELKRERERHRGGVGEGTREQGFGGERGVGRWGEARRSETVGPGRWKQARTGGTAPRR
jgi:hypothetical protein